MIEADALSTPAHRDVRSASLKLSVVAALAALSDWLIYSHNPGISVAILFAAVAIGVLCVNRRTLQPRRGLAAGLIALLALTPIIENLNTLSFLFGLIGLAAFALVVSGYEFANARQYVFAPLRLLAVGPFRAAPDLAVMALNKQLPAANIAQLSMWVLPIALGAVFLALFAAANPMIESWMSAIDISALLKLVSVPRLLYWVFAFSAIWGLVCVRGFTKRQRKTPSASVPSVASGSSSLGGVLFGDGAMLRSLILFNVLFALQTALDIAFLWRGAALPNGMSYATYAHRGAYPLMLTALLAAAFVVISFGPGSTLSKSALGRGLLFAWIGQNVLLVLSSILRLNLYVEVYSLSYWRVAAFIWMALVALGLLLILARIACDWSNAWLISANVLTAVAVLYVCCFVNFAHMIANYNVTHSREVSGTGTLLDVNYIACLGPQAVPAMDRFMRLTTSDPRHSLAAHRNRLADRATRSDSEWRTWSYRDHRLMAYLRQLSTAALAPIPTP